MYGKTKPARPFAKRKKNARGEHGPVDQALSELYVRVDVSPPAGPPRNVMPRLFIAGPRYPAITSTPIKNQ